jgi:hypothetical protein
MGCQGCHERQDGPRPFRRFLIPLLEDSARFSPPQYIIPYSPSKANGSRMPSVRIGSKFVEPQESKVTLNISVQNNGSNLTHHCYCAFEISSAATGA